MGKIYLAEKTQLDSAKTPFALCSTAAATAAKTVTASGFSLKTGAMISVKFTYANTAANPTLDVNGTGAISIYYHNLAVPTGMFTAGGVYLFVYDGARWELMGNHFVPSTSASTPGSLICRGASGSTNGIDETVDFGGYKQVLSVPLNFSELSAQGYKFILISYITCWYDSPYGDMKGNEGTVRICIKNQSDSLLYYRDTRPGQTQSSFHPSLIPISNITGTNMLNVEIGGGRSSNAYTNVHCNSGPIYVIT